MNTKVIGGAILATLGFLAWSGGPGRIVEPEPPQAHAADDVAGEQYQICKEPGYLTSSWAYDALKTGSRSYTATRYEALSGYGATLPPLPAYLASQPNSPDVVTIYAPGQNISLTSYKHPSNPELFFFEGGSYGTLAVQALSGDEYIGGSATGYAEPLFDEGDATTSSQGIQPGQDHYAFSGAGDALASAAGSGATGITVTTAPSQYASHVAFVDSSGLHVYAVSSVSGNTINLSSGLIGPESSGALLWYDDGQRTLGAVAGAAAAGATTVTTGTMNWPVVPGEALGFGSSDGQVDNYYVSAVSGSQSSGYTLTMATPLGGALPLDAPIWYEAPAGDETVEYLTLDQFAPITTGAISGGADNTIEHNLIENGTDGTDDNSGNGIFEGATIGTHPPAGTVPGSTIEYNCIQHMGDGGMYEFGNGSTFAYNEVLQPGIFPSTDGGAGDKWWGTENSTVLDNAFVDSSNSPLWFDDGNTGYLVQGNYFYACADRCIDDETAFNGDITGNLFLDSGWDGLSGPCNAGQCEGVVNLDDSGAWPIRGSNYDNPSTGCPSGQTQGCLLVRDNTFSNDWEGVTIWGEGNRSCLIPGESTGTPPYNNSPYCSGGFPNGDGDFSNYHYPDNGSTLGTLQQAATSASSTLYMTQPPPVNDQIGFSGPGSSGYLSASTTDTTNVSSFTGSGTINAADPMSAGFATPASSCGMGGNPPCPELMVATSNASYQGQMVGAVLSYSGISSTQFTGVDLVRGTGTLAGWISPVEPYTVTAVSGSAPDYRVTINPGISSAEAANTSVYDDGTCQLYDTPAATPSGPLAPDGMSYFDGCIWENRNISVSGNTFDFEPTEIASGPNFWGNKTYQTCDSSHTNYCGTNFMAWYTVGPSSSWVYANALMSHGSFTTPLTTGWRRTLAGGEPAWNDTWSDNTYIGPWQWYVYSANGSNCKPPRGHSCTPTVSQWSSEWKQH